MSIITNVGAIARHWRHWRRAVRTERAIAALPSDVRKDIGWPDRYTAEIGHHPTRDHFGH